MSIINKVPVSTSLKNIDRSVIEIYRDCFRLIRHVAGKSRKGEQMRYMVRTSFKKHMDVRDEEEIKRLKLNAVQGLANYLTMTSLKAHNISVHN